MQFTTLWIKNINLNLTQIKLVQCKTTSLVFTFEVPVSSVWLWWVNSVSSLSRTVSTTSLVIAEISKPTQTKKTNKHSTACQQQHLSFCRSSVWDTFNLTRVSGKLQALWAEPWLSDGLQEHSVLSSGEFGGKLANIASYEVCLLVSNQEGDVRFQHINTHLLLRDRGSETSASSPLKCSLLWSTWRRASNTDALIVCKYCPFYLQRQTQRAEKKHQVRHKPE